MLIAFEWEWFSLMHWDWLNDQLRHLLNPLYYTPMGEFMRSSRWAWPTFESLHFIGLSLLIGTIGMFDLPPQRSLGGRYLCLAGQRRITLARWPPGEAQCRPGSPPGWPPRGRTGW